MLQPLRGLTRCPAGQGAQCGGSGCRQSAGRATNQRRMLFVPPPRQVDYKRPMPASADVVCSARVESVEGRKVRVPCSLLAASAVGWSSPVAEPAACACRRGGRAGPFQAGALKAALPWPRPHLPARCGFMRKWRTGQGAPSTPAGVRCMSLPSSQPPTATRAAAARALVWQWPSISASSPLRLPAAHAHQPACIRDACTNIAQQYASPNQSGQLLGHAPLSSFLPLCQPRTNQLASFHCLVFFSVYLFSSPFPKP